MASSYTVLGTEKMTTGENAGTWGTKTNTNIEILEQEYHHLSRTEAKTKKEYKAEKKKLSKD